MPGRFDSTLQDVLYLILDTGYGEVYDELSPFYPDSELLKALDSARGGKFEDPPKNYPPGAWFHLDEEDCDRECMAIEYFYWGLTTLLGA